MCSSDLQWRRAPEVPGLHARQVADAAAGVAAMGHLLGGDFGKMSLDPSIADNLSKVAGAHALKFGVYWDFAENDQPGGLGNVPQGLVAFGNTGADSSGNPMADFVTGRVQSFHQVPALSVYDLKQNQYSLYAQDQWKIEIGRAHV